MTLAMAYDGFAGTVQNRSYASLSTTRISLPYVPLEDTSAPRAVRPQHLPLSRTRGRPADGRATSSNRWPADGNQSAVNEQRLRSEDGEGGPRRRSHYRDHQHTAWPLHHRR